MPLQRAYRGSASNIPTRQRFWTVKRHKCRVPSTVSLRSGFVYFATAQEKQAGRSQPDKGQAGRLGDDRQVANSEIVGRVIRPTRSTIVRPEIYPTDWPRERS